MSQQAIKVGQLEIRYLVDGAQSGGLGLFEMKVPAGAHVPPPHSHTATRNASTCSRACFATRSTTKPAT